MPHRTSIIHLIFLLILAALLGIGIYLILNGNAFADQAVLTTASPSPSAANVISTDEPSSITQ